MKIWGGDDSAQRKSNTYYSSEKMTKQIRPLVTADICLVAANVFI